MVVTKMERRLHACAVSCAGHGRKNLMMTPVATAIAADVKCTGCTSHILLNMKSAHDADVGESLFAGALGV